MIDVFAWAQWELFHIQLLQFTNILFSLMWYNSFEIDDRPSGYDMVHVWDKRGIGSRKLLD